MPTHLDNISGLLPIKTVLRDHVAHLIDILDALDIDPDFEETGDLEPSLGFYYGKEPDLELDRSDFEDSLGSPELATYSQPLSQTKWARGEAGDREDDGDDREETGDDEYSGDEHEPSLGSRQDVNQTGWAMGGSDDRELEHDGMCEAEDRFYVRRPAIEVLEAEAASARAATARLHAILERLRAPQTFHDPSFGSMPLVPMHAIGRSGLPLIR